MELWYRLLGCSAAVGAALSRHRVNLVSMSLFPFVFLVLLPIIAYGISMDADEATTPQPASLREIATNREYQGPRFITVQGKFDPKTIGDKKFRIRRTTLVTTLVAFVDAKSGGAVMVEFDTEDRKELDLTPTRMTGMLRQVYGPLGEGVPARAGGLPLAQNFYFEPGDQPLRPGIWPHVLMGLTLLLVTYAVAFAQRYVIFRPDRGEAAQRPAERVQLQVGADLRVSGRLFHQGYTHQRFLSVPMHVGVFDDDSIALTASLYAFTQKWLYVFPAGKDDHSGEWTLWIALGSVKNLRRGRQYLGSGSRPALRFSYVSGYSRKSETAVISFGSDLEREAMLSTLQTLAA